MGKTLMSTPAHPLSAKGKDAKKANEDLQEVKRRWKMTKEGINNYGLQSIESGITTKSSQRKLQEKTCRSEDVETTTTIGE